MIARSIRARQPAPLAELEDRAKADPDDPILLARLGIVQASSTNQSRLQRRLPPPQAFPRNAEVMLTLAQLYSGPLGDPDQARLMAKSVHEIMPNDPRVSEILGKLLYQDGRLVWSEELLQEAARAKPSQPALQYELALARYAVGSNFRRGKHPEAAAVGVGWNLPSGMRPASWRP